MSRQRREEIENLSTFAAYRSKIKDIRYIDDNGGVEAMEENVEGYDLPF